MPTITWQDGFEGSEDLIAVYGAANVLGGPSIAVGSGRGGGNALSCSGSGVRHDIGIAASSDPVQVGIARHAGDGGNDTLEVSDTIGTVAALGVDSVGRAYVTLDTLAGFPTVHEAASEPRLGGIWRYLEWYFVAAPVTGRIVVAVDGDTVIDYSGKTAAVGRGPTACRTQGSSALVDDWYLALGDPGGASFYGDYRITGTAPGASGSVPAGSDVRVDQQFVTAAYDAPKQDVRVDQQFIIVAIKNRPGAHVRPQVVGNGRV